MGWTYNTADPDAPTMGPVISQVAVILTAVSLIMVLLRAYVRFGMIKAAGIGKTCSEHSGCGYVADGLY
jgi:hypothetical protein